MSWQNKLLPKPPIVDWLALPPCEWKPDVAGSLVLSLNGNKIRVHDSLQEMPWAVSHILRQQQGLHGHHVLVQGFGVKISCPSTDALRAANHILAWRRGE